MKRLAVAVMAAVCAVMFLAQMALAADKFAYVELSRLISEYTKTKDYDKYLGDKETSYNTEREKRVNEAKELQDKMNLLSDKEKEGRKTELEEKVKSLQEFDQQKVSDIRKEFNERRVEIMRDIDASIKIIAAKEGYTAVFNEAGVVYTAPALNITNKVLEALNKEYAKK
jgi:Skp family chaperone for outer membrane proteins